MSTKLVNGKRVEMTAEEIAAVTPSLDDLKYYRKQEVNVYRDSLYGQGYTYQGNTFQIDAEARADMMFIDKLLDKGVPNPHKGDWRTVDDQNIPMNDAEVAAFFLAAGAYVASIKQRAMALKDQIQGSSDPESIDITTGWPEQG